MDLEVLLSRHRQKPIREQQYREARLLLDMLQL
jgi:hypothetical protein